MRPYFDHVLTSAGEGIYKSDPEIFRRACARLDAAPSETVHIGDHARYDVQTARSAGLRTIWFAANAHHTAQLHNHDWAELQRQGNEADAIVHNHPEIPTLIANM
jgi:FMN phosphatase YigB (HAD superfamily)